MKHYRAVINIDALERLSKSQIVLRVMGRFGNLRDMEIGLAQFESRPLLDVNIQPEETTLEEKHHEENQS